jgi:hypothetical protein
MGLGKLSMTLEQAILDAVRALPADKQKAILDHAGVVFGPILTST